MIKKISIDLQYFNYCKEKQINISKWVNRKMGDEFLDKKQKIERINKEIEEKKKNIEVLKKEISEEKKRKEDALKSISEEEKKEIQINNH